MTAIILKILKWIFILGLIFITLFFGKFYFAKQDSIPKHIHEALRKALGEEKEAFDRQSTERKEEKKKHRDAIDEKNERIKSLKVGLSTRKSQIYTSRRIINKLKEDTTKLIAELKRLREITPDIDEVFYLSHGAKLERTIKDQEVVIAEYEDKEFHFLKTDTIQEKEIEALTDRVSDLERFPLLYLDEKCRVSLIPFSTKKGWVSKKCVKKYKSSIL